MTHTDAAPPSQSLTLLDRIVLEGEGPLDAHRLYRSDLLAAPLDALAGTIKLVYFDPPFGTGDRFDAHVDIGEKRLFVPAYDDVWEGGIDGLLAFIEPRLRAIHRLLADDGSLILHADHRATPYLAVLCDTIFGRGDREGTGTRPGFRNEIIWRYGLGGSSHRTYPKKHDVLLWYTKSDAWYFTAPRVPATSRRMAGLDKKCPDVWDIPSLNNMARERNGYPTQKPEALLERIVSAHTREGERVLDPGFGSGTSAFVSHQLGRRFVGTDPSPMAFHRTRERLFAARASHVVGAVESYVRVPDENEAVATFRIHDARIEVLSITLPAATDVARFDDIRDSLAAIASVRVHSSTAPFTSAAHASGGPHAAALPENLAGPVCVRVTDVLGRAFAYTGTAAAFATGTALPLIRCL
jgi:hypothetical protein